MPGTLEIGNVVERYRVLSQLGEGGMAAVYLVEHEKLGTRHALKVLTIGNREVQRRTLQEGKVQATLRHPNIVAVTDVLDVDGAPALLMEYIEGPPLDAWLHTYRPSQDEALQIFRGIVAGVKYAHDLGLIHRDLKPANVMLQPTPEGIIPKVTDFGLAKALGADSGLKKTRTGTTMGTPAYMAPEQIRDASTVDRRADVYSLGCILYELVCGRPPYDAPDILTLFGQVADGRYPPPETIVAECPGAVRDAIAGAMKTKVEERLADCAALVDVLYAQPGQASASKGFSGGVTLFSDSPAAQAIHTLVQERRKTPVSRPPVERADSTGTWIDTNDTPAPSASRRSRGSKPPVPVTQQTSMAPPANPSITSISPLVASQPPASPWPVRIAVGVSVGALFVALLGVGAGMAIAMSSSNTAPAPAIPAMRPIVIEKPAPAATVEPVVPVAPDPVPDPPPEPPKAEAEPPKTKAEPPKTKVATVEPVKVEPEPVKVEPVAEPAAPQGAVFSFSGAQHVVLVGADGKEYAAGSDVPPGSYQVRAWFEGAQEPAGAGKVTVGAGQQLTFKCNAAIAQCKKQ